VHDTHHPSSVEIAYEQQKAAAAVRAEAFRDGRLPKFFGYFEGLLAGGPYVVGDTLSYADLAVWQAYAGASYAFPRAVASLAGHAKRLRAHHARIAKRPRIAAYLKSRRRLAFNEMGIFRHYPELDAKVKK
jgi:glutathione S-transferase